MLFLKNNFRLLPVNGDWLKKECAETFLMRCFFLLNGLQEKNKEIKVCGRSMED
jgi:hypothetical protein